MESEDKPKPPTVMEIHEELIAEGTRKAEKKKRIREQKKAYERLAKLKEKGAA